MRVRKAAQDDRAAVARLLFESAVDMYERFSGGRRRERPSSADSQ